MEKYRQSIGKLGEQKAKNYLKRRGYQILDSNYRTKAGEIDLIVKDQDCLVFVEVKTRTSEEYGTPAEAVSFYKQQHMLKSAQYYLLRHGGECECRFDVIEVRLPARGWLRIATINHIKNVLQ
ncbi:MAG: YraN family protein [Clostridia bacterium]|nr:YraN family protein [Clostridia bacterium]